MSTVAFLEVEDGEKAKTRSLGGRAMGAKIPSLELDSTTPSGEEGSVAGGLATIGFMLPSSIFCLPALNWLPYGRSFSLNCSL